MKKTVLLLVAILFVAAMVTSVLAITKEEAQKNVAAAQAAYNTAKKNYDTALADYNKAMQGKDARMKLLTESTKNDAAKTLRAKDEALKKAKEELDKVTALNSRTGR
jgi:F0F1-type ATP synthase membrane subunit b/b'